MSEQVHKITLSSGKVVLLRDPKIRHNELAVKAVGNRAGENKFLFAQLVQKELLKILLHSIGQKGSNPLPVDPNQAENLDSLLTIQEYGQVMKIIAKFQGDDEVGEPVVEFSTVSGT